VSELEAIDPGTVALHPERLPPGLDDDAAVAGNLNLLIGRFEPRAQRRRRVFSQLLSLAALTVVIVLLAIGLERRASYFRASAASAAAATDRLIASALPRGSKPGALAAEVARQQQAARSALNIAPAPDAAVALSALLKAWPSDAACKPQALTVNESGMTVSVLVEGDPAPFLREFRAPAGWSLEEPRLNTNREFTRIAIVLKPEKRSAP
jgi:hypothetical protein